MSFEIISGRLVFVTHLEMQISSQSLLHFSHAQNVVQNLSSLEISFFTWMDFAFRCTDVGLLLPPLLLFEEAGATRIVDATVSRCMLERSTFVLTMFESCEFTTASFENSRHTSLRLVFLRAQRGTLLYDVRVVTMNFIHKLSWPRLIKIFTAYPGELSNGTCTSIPRKSKTVAIPIFQTGPISWFASIDAYGLQSSMFLALCNLCPSTCVFSIRRHQE